MGIRTFVGPSILPSHTALGRDSFLLCFFFPLFSGKHFGRVKDEELG